MSKESSTAAAPEWDRVADRFRRGTVMVVGQPGLGKTTLARYLAGRLSENGERVGLLSTDMGQASVGVPCCLGLALAEPWQEPAALWFIGATAPIGHLLPTVVGAARLADHARRQGVQMLVVDTTGLVQGPLGRVLKYHKALALNVDYVVAIQRGVELKSLLALLEGPCASIHRLQPVPEARARDAVERKQYREALFREHFQGGSVLRFDSSQVVSPEWEPGLPLRSTDLGEAKSGGTVVGLLDSKGFCLGLGLLEELRAGRLLVYTACRDSAAVARLQLGNLRLDRWGQEIG